MKESLYYNYVKILAQYKLIKLKYISEYIITCYYDISSFNCAIIFVYMYTQNTLCACMRAQNRLDQILNGVLCT